MAAAAVEEELSFDTDKLSYEIFSMLESKFLFGYDDTKLWVPAAPPLTASSAVLPVAAAADSVKSQRGKVCVLCIDGGGGCGMLGILPGKVLAYLEHALKSKSGDPNARISDYFDVAAGTGVGGVLAAMLFATRDGALPLFCADDTWRFFADRGERLFRKASPSPSSSGFLRCLFPGGGGSTTAATERAMKEVFGEDLTLRDTVNYDLRTRASTSDCGRCAGPHGPSFGGSSRRRSARWTEPPPAAPWAELRRFEPAEISSVDGATSCVAVDGGLAMSNPAAAAITHVLHNKQEFPFVRGVEDLMVLSLGCGEMAETEHLKLGRWGPMQGARPIARIAADLVDHAVALAFGQCRSSNYVRVQASGWSTGMCSVDASPGNVKALSEAAEEMVRQKNVESVLFGGKRISEQTTMEKLDWFAGELVVEHQRRNCRIAPSVAFKQAVTKSSSMTSLSQAI
ncbi:hypothetical protein B296_00007724 [Ensete ventricosum]|uniref:Patatin n=1 Tax=Ensete ventricosum TaxID=4639 RepID=A0A427B4Q3_ENSVE|nr:hypothetical protein B296_00007724 [Ensete ventricosum]